METSKEMAESYTEKSVQAEAEAWKFVKAGNFARAYWAMEEALSAARSARVLDAIAMEAEAEQKLAALKQKRARKSPKKPSLS